MDDPIGWLYRRDEQVCVTIATGWTAQVGTTMKTIRALRQEREWSQFELAVRIGVHPQAIYLWESGRRVPQVPQLRKLGQLFGLCSDDIDLIDPPATVKRAPRRDRPGTDMSTDRRAQET